MANRVQVLEVLHSNSRSGCSRVADLVRRAGELSVIRSW